MMQCFGKIVNDFDRLSVFVKKLIADVWLGSKYSIYQSILTPTLI